MDISFFKKSKTDTENISSREAFNIWDILRARYNSVESLYFFNNFVHDREFSYLINNLIKDYQKQVDKLEKLAKKYKLKVPASPTKEMTFSVQLDQVTDKFVFRKVFSDLVFELSSLNQGVISTAFNDELRDHFVKFTFAHLNNFQTLYKYGKVKGWTEIPPAYKTYKPVEKEELSVSEASNLWHHLNLRYDQLNMTTIFIQFVHDNDLKTILKMGQKTLEKQISTLEEKAKKMEVPKPERPPAFNQATIDPEIFTDQFMFRRIFKGIQEAVDLHITAVVETITNDSLRDLFLQYLKKEISIFNKLLKYGKVKGWDHIPPLYKQF